MTLGQKIHSAAFRFQNESLGLTGEGAQTTELDDSGVTQVRDISALAVYGLAPGNTYGLVSSVIEHSHVAAGTVTASMDPYDPGTRINRFSVVTFNDFDLWYLGSDCQVTTSTQTQTEEQVAIDSSSDLLGFSEGVTTARDIILAHWDVAGGNAGLGSFRELAATQIMFQPFRPFIWPRGSNWISGSSTSGAGSTTLSFTSLWAMTPRALPNVVA